MYRTKNLLAAILTCALPSSLTASPQSPCFSAGPTYASPIGYTPVFADINNDGLDDLITGESWGSRIHVRLGAVNGTFGAVATIPSCSQPTPQCAGDFDGDGNLDVIVKKTHAPTNLFGIHYGNGQGGFGPFNTIEAGSDVSHVISWDINADGALDLIRSGTDTKAWINQSGSFAPQTAGVWPSLNGPVLGLSDMNADGHVDVVANSGPATGAVVYYCDASFSILSQELLYTENLSTSAFCFFDLDQDSHPDVASIVSGAVMVIAGGPGAFQAVSLPCASPGTKLTSLDVDGDGDDDLAVTNSPSSSSSGFYIIKNGGGSLTECYSFPTSFRWFQFISGYDFDRDGAKDIVLYGHTQGIELRRNCTPQGPTADVTALLDGGSTLPFGVRDLASCGLPSGGAMTFGGYTASGPSLGTYTFESGQWRLQFPFISPAARAGHAIAADAANNVSLMFGGADPAGAPLGDTWTYANGQWTYKTPSTSPSARSGHAMTFESLGDSVLLVGGQDSSGAYLADTWRWDGTNWTQITTSTAPPARSNHGLVFDEYRGRVVLFGGTDGNSRLNDVWEWDGLDWTKKAPLPGSSTYGPVAREKFVMTYDPFSERAIVMGGESDGGCVDDVWSWDGIGWTRHLPASNTSLPSARSGATSVVDAVSGEMRVFGGGCGSTLFDEAWTFDFPVTHRYSTFGVGCAGTAGVPALDVQPGTRPVVGETLVAILSNIPVSPGAVAFGLLGVSRERWAGGPLPVDLSGIGMPGCSLLTSADDTSTLPNTGGQASVALPVTQSLVGYTLYLQCAVLDRFANPLGIVLSNGLEFRIGDR